MKSDSRSSENTVDTSSAPPPVTEIEPIISPKSNAVKKTAALAKVDSIVAGVFGAGLDSDEEFDFPQSLKLGRPTNKAVSSNNEEEFW